MHEADRNTDTPTGSYVLFAGARVGIPTHTEKSAIVPIVYQTYPFRFHELSAKLRRHTDFALFERALHDVCMYVISSWTKRVGVASKLCALDLTDIRTNYVVGLGHSGAGGSIDALSEVEKARAHDPGTVLGVSACSCPV